MPHHDTNQEIYEMEQKLKSLKQKARGDQGNAYFVPAAILIAGVLIAGAVFYSGGKTQNTQPSSAANAPAQPPQAVVPSFAVDSASGIKNVTSQDHIRGSIDAPVKIVEFSDTECPFCKRFHPTMRQVMDEYGKDGRVAWVYRHFPLDQIHSKARIEASATELAAELGGNDKFWEYLDKLFEITPANDRLDLSLLPQIAQDIGLDRKPFEDLVAKDDRRGGKYADHIESDLQDATASGGRGTPYSVVIAPNGKTFPLSGAQPYGSVRSIIELALKEI